ncbi:hypothetical protein [Pleurocapsa sp. FMAR1]|nr:hypothetical protein [Pleurocapsa sp. FMAR1]
MKSEVRGQICRYDSRVHAEKQTVLILYYSGDRLTPFLYLPKI